MQDIGSNEQPGQNWLIENGYKLFPVHEKGKPPYAWNREDIAVGDAPAWGVRLGLNDLIVDIDPRNFAADEFGNTVNSFSLLEQHCGLDDGWEKDTLVVKTPSGGYHIYVRLPDGLQSEHLTIRKKDTRFPGLDFLTYRSYAVGVGSQFPSTPNPYMAATSPRAPMAIPPALLNYVTERLHDRTPQVAETAVTDDDADNVKAFEVYLAGVSIPETGRRSDIFYSVACRGRDLGLSEDRTAYMVHEWQSAECGCTYADVKERCANAFRYNRNTPGVIAPSRFKNGWAEEAAKVAESPKVSFLDVNKLLEELNTPLYGDDQAGPSGYDVTAEQMIVDGEGTPKKCLQNLIVYLMRDNFGKCLRLNELDLSIEVFGQLPWRRKGDISSLSDDDLIFLEQYVERSIRISFPEKTHLKAMRVISEKNRYHPIKRYIESTVWDGVPRLNQWLVRYCGAIDTEYVRRVGKLFVQGAVKRIYQPGCKFDYVMILEGNEGTGKSSVANILGGKWYANAFIDPKDKDTVSLINRSWIVEVAEMEVFKKAEANALKAFITRATDNIRLPYEKIVRPIDRHSVFLGTINPEESGYLADDAENRRYWPVWTEKIDLKGLSEVRDQLFAEAYALYKEGKDALFLETESLVAMQREEVEKRKQADPWTFLIGDYLKANPQLDGITMRTLCLDLLGMKPDRMRRGDQSRVGRVMKRLGWEHNIVDGQGGYTRPVFEILAREEKSIRAGLKDLKTN